jgi:hypothetical protein
MPASKSETRGRFCDGLGSNIVVQYSASSIITPHGRITARDYVDRLCNQVHLIIQTLFPNNDADFQDDIARIHSAETAETVRFCRGWKSMKMNLNMFPDQHIPQI